MDKIRVGIIGCGKQAEKHILSLKKIPGLEIIVTDINKEISHKLAKKEGTLWEANPESLFKQDDVKGVVICTPTRTHVYYLKKAVEAQKDVLCEKPLSDSLEEIYEAEKLISASNSIVLIGYLYRFVPIFEEGYEIFRAKQLNGNSLLMGKPLSAYFRLGGRGDHQVWKHLKDEGGGAINEMLVHMVDLANWYFGPLEQIEVVSCDLRKPHRVINGTKTTVDAEDFILVRARGASGVEIFCQADLITPSFSQYVEVQAENGSFMGSIQNDFRSYIHLKESRGGFPAGKTEFNFKNRNIVDIQMTAFILSMLRSRTMERNTVQDSLQLIKIMEEVRRQTEE